MHLQLSPRTLASLADAPTARTAPAGPGFPQLLVRGVAVVALAGVALVHLVQLPDTAHQMPGLAVLFGALSLATAGLGAALVRADSRRLWLAAALTATAALGGYVLTRTTAVPFDNGDVGNWLEPLGLAALFVEGALLVLCCYRLRLGAPASCVSGTRAGDVG
jgi:hypothetical protein